MHPSKLLPLFILVTIIGLLVTRQQITETLLLYEIQEHQDFVRQLEDKHQLLQHQVHALASPEMLTLALGQQTGPKGHPVAVVQVAEGEEEGLRLVTRGRGLLERLSLIKTAEAHSR